MTEGWKKVPASAVQEGDRVRVAGDEFVVSSIEAPFFGRAELIAFIEDSPERWFKRPVPTESEVEVLQPG